MPIAYSGRNAVKSDYMQFRIWLARCGPAAVALGVGLLSGCPLIANTTGTNTNRAFRADQVAKIERNQTTKRQIIEWFGAPPTIARTTQESDFSMFAASQRISDGSVVYHYRNVSRTSSETVGGVIVLPVPQGGFGGTLARSAWEEVDELWILFDGRTGLVQDFIVKEPRER